MGGRASRQKGSRGEYLARDLFRSMGWEADRVPASGAAQGFKGDLRIRKFGIERTVEVKNEKYTYKTVYEFLDAFTGEGGAMVCSGPLTVHLSYNFNDLGLAPLGDFTAKSSALVSAKFKGVKRILGMAKLVKSCDLLMVKNNNRPFIFLRYRGVK